MKINVSSHAIGQHIKRFGGSSTTKSINNKINSIRKIVAFGIEIEPKSKMMKLLNNRCRKAKYYMNGGIVAVVEDDTVVTVYKYEIDKFRDIMAVRPAETGRPKL